MTSRGYCGVVSLWSRPCSSTCRWPTLATRRHRGTTLRTSGSSINKMQSVLSHPDHPWTTSCVSSPGDWAVPIGSHLPHHTVVTSKDFAPRRTFFKFAMATSEKPGNESLTMIAVHPDKRVRVLQRVSQPRQAPSAGRSSNIHRQRSHYGADRTMHAAAMCLWCGTLPINLNIIRQTYTTAGHDFVTTSGLRLLEAFQSQMPSASTTTLTKYAQHCPLHATACGGLSCGFPTSCGPCG